MDLSLDEYILQKKINSANKKKDEDKTVTYTNMFDRPRNREEEEDDDDDDEMQGESRALWKAPSSKINTLKFSEEAVDVEEECESFDLREKINDMPNAESQNWRLISPNVANARPAGMPPLVPLMAPPKRHNNNNNNGYNNNNRYNNNNGYNNNNRRRRYNKKRNYRNYNNNWGVNKYTNNQKGKTLKQAMQHLSLERQALEPIVNIKVPVDRSEKLVPRNVPLSNMVAASSKSVSNNNLLDRALFPNCTPTATGGTVKTFNDLLNINNNEVMPHIMANKLLSLISNNTSVSTQHKPVYDMKIHKEIHQIQGKSFLYECGTGGSLLSGDGPGINNVKINPNSTDTSLNCRFS